MAKYTGPEEKVKSSVYEDWFKKFEWEPIGKIDFAVYGFHKKEKHYFLWAEAKKGDNHDIYDSFVQLLLTVGKDRTFTKISHPKYFGAFDGLKIGFIAYEEFRDVFNKIGLNWNVVPSDHSTEVFKELKKIVLDKLQSKVSLFMYDEDEKELNEFIKKNFVFNLTETQKILIDNNTFPEVFQKWYKEVFPAIEDFSDMDVMAGDFFLADLMDKSELSFEERLRIVLKYKNEVPYYEVKHEYIKKRDRFNFNVINFTNKSYVNFWNKYERPPLRQYIEKIISRRDLLVLPDVREREGSFYTPQIWAKKAKEYLRQTLGNNWQDEYYIWDCCAGAGNLLFDLTEGHRIYASTLGNSDVLIMKECLKETVPESHIFEFDFLNDDLQGDKMPDSLKDILNNPKKRKKLVIFINPPYAEAGNVDTINGLGKHKTGVAVQKKTYKDYLPEIGLAGRELFAQFLIRIYKEINGCILGNFCTLKILQASNFDKFRNVFQAKLKSLFMMPANTFDNVNGNFPIGFFIWDTSIVESFQSIEADIYDIDGFCFKKTIRNTEKSKRVNDWLLKYKDKKNKFIGFLSYGRNDFQHQNNIYLLNEKSQMPVPRGVEISINNLYVICIYFAVGHCISHTVWNHNDQFLFPNDDWESDEEFKNNCLAYTLFHGKNCIISKDFINHWIPFSEKEVGAKDAYESHFMIDFIKGKIGGRKEGSLFEESDETEHAPSLQGAPIVFSEKARMVMDAGRELWRYYHSKCGENPNASYYDIKRYFQGVNEKGKMNPKSEKDEKYNELHEALKSAMKVLAKEIEAKVYEYGFLLR